MSDGYGATTSLSVPWTPAPVEKPGYGPDPCCQPCPDCGGLECLCRPRFFAGQLLTEQDLNRLDHYIVEKNKLHNRHLVGWGVVCGLEVLCDQCEDRVRVTPGYAISPCGEDIVVCKPDVVDICALIDRCRKTDEADCRPYAGKDGCEDIEEEWVLAIRFMESPARGMTALTGTSSCGCGAPSASACGCGGGGSGGCSCGGNGGGTSAPAPVSAEAPRLRRGAPPTCEPTIVCETYRYEIFRKPEDEEKDKDPIDSNWFIASFAGVFEKLDGEFAHRVTCCLRDLEKALPKPPGDLHPQMTLDEKKALVRWACAAKRSLATYFSRRGGSDCEIVMKLNAILVPDAGAANFDQEFEQALKELAIVAIQGILHCICSNLLPPCPAPEDPRVPLAVVTIRRKDCHILKVCNWTPLRRHVTTFRTLDYWTGWLPLRRLVRDAIEAVCCHAFGLIDEPVIVQPGTGQPVAEPINVDSTKEAMTSAAAKSAAPPPPGGGETAEAAAKPALGEPLKLRLGEPRRRTRVLAKAALASLQGPDPTAADIVDLAFRRPVFPTGDFANPEDEKRMVDQLAQSGMMRMIGGVLGATGLPERALALAGRALQQRGGDREMVELRARLDRQDAEIAELRRSVAKAGPADDGKR
jgi:hypothetical protein